jgi:hypothetical protein
MVGSLVEQLRLNQQSKGLIHARIAGKKIQRSKWHYNSIRIGSLPWTRDGIIGRMTSALTEGQLRGQPPLNEKKIPIGNELQKISR